MSIEGVKFCDLCGSAIAIHDIAPIRVDEDGHRVQLRLHNRHRNDCLTLKLTQMAEQYAGSALAVVSDGMAQEPVQHEA
jgi:hypothetical protein